MQISESIILSTFSDFFQLSWIALKEGLLDLKFLDFKANWELNFSINQEFFVIALENWLSNKFINWVQDFLNFFFKIFDFIVDNDQMRMASPSDLSSLIYFNCSFSIFISCLVVFEGVKLLGTISSSYQMENCVVSSISEIDCVPSLII